MHPHRAGRRQSVNFIGGEPEMIEYLLRMFPEERRGPPDLPWRIGHDKRSPSYG